MTFTCTSGTYDQASERRVKLRLAPGLDLGCSGLVSFPCVPVYAPSTGVTLNNLTLPWDSMYGIIMYANYPSILVGVAYTYYYIYRIPLRCFCTQENTQQSRRDPDTNVGLETFNCITSTTITTKCLRIIRFNCPKKPCIKGQTSRW